MMHPVPPSPAQRSGLCQFEGVAKLLLALALSTCAAPAQPVVDALKVRQLLSSPVLQDRAWGVFWASRLALPGSDSLFLDQLDSLQPYAATRSDSAESACIDAVFDALISSGKSVPAQRLTPFAPHWRDEVLILLARQPGNNEDLLLSMRNEQSTQQQWTAVNNLLLRMRSQRFFAKTLAELSIRHRFVIVDHSAVAAEAAGGGGFALCGSRQLPKGFPPIGIYQLTDTRAEGDVLVVSGPRDVYYRRTVIQTDTLIGLSVTGATFERQQDLLAYLAAWNHGRTEDARQTFLRTTTVVWRGAGVFQRTAEAALGAQMAAIQAFLATAKQCAAPDLSGTRLKIVVDIEDHRKNGLPPPPDVADKAFTIP